VIASGRGRHSLRRPKPQNQSILFRMASVVQAHTDDHTVCATSETAKEAFAKAIEWQLVHKYTTIVISDGTRGFTVTEFVSVMALKAIANTVRPPSN